MVVKNFEENANYVVFMIGILDFSLNDWIGGI